MIQHAANDQLFHPRTLRLETGLRRPVRATLYDTGLVVTNDLAARSVALAGWTSGRRGPLVRSFPVGWLQALCTALLSAGVAPDRPLIVRRRLGEPVCTCLSIGDVAAAGDP